MRLICTLNDQKQAAILSTFLASEGIENQLEISANTDWGSSNYGDVTCKIWIYDEDAVSNANRWIETFQQDPNNPLFHKTSAPVIPQVISPPQQDNKLTVQLNRGFKMPPTSEREPMGTLTFAILMICCALFIITEITAPFITTLPPGLPPTPIVSSPVKKAMLYDYPLAFEIVDKLVNVYGVDKLQNLQDLPPEGQYILNKLKNTPYWQGFYAIIERKFENSNSSFEPQAPLFEKIRQGEVWRLFTPCLLHNDILHILFNMIWLVILGKQIEQRLSISRYVILTLILGIFSNTCQYLMSGANFIGFSGVLCGLLTFIWIRQKVAAWEGYPLQKATITFMMFFIFSMFTLQLISFYLEFNKQISISPGIANTAHLTGATMGAILGRLPFFSWKT